MKVLMGVLLVCCAASALGAITKERKEHFMKMKEECVKSSGVDVELLMKAKSGEKVEETDELKEFVYCMFKKAGFLNEKEEIDSEKMKNCLTEKFDEATAEKLMEKCAKDVKETGKAAAVKVGKCMLENKPHTD